MSWHKRDWLLAGLLGAAGAATGGFGLLGGGLLGGAGAGAAEGAGSGLLTALTGTPEIGAAYGAAIPELGVEGAALGSYGAAIPELGAPAENIGLLGKLGGLADNKDAMRAFQLANMAQGQQPQPQAAPMQRPPPQQVAQAPQDPRIEELRKRRGMMPMGSFLG
jgi:hypothetical protein